MPWQIELLAAARALRILGPQRRRVAFAFDPRRRAVLLVAGDKSGVAQRRFYRQLIARADDRLDGHLAALRRR